MGEKIPTFMCHQQRFSVLDGDHAMLHLQVDLLCPWSGFPSSTSVYLLTRRRTCGAQPKIMLISHQGLRTTQRLQCVRCVQERIVQQEVDQLGGSWKKSYYMPTESDRSAACPAAPHGT